MPLWLTEDPSTVYFLLGLAALGCAVGLWVRQERIYLYGLCGIVGVIALIALIDYLVVTDYERIVLNVKEVAAAVRIGC
jgi:hypothetical protein